MKSSTVNFDAVVDLLSPEAPGGQAYVLVKYTCLIEGGACSGVEPEPLWRDLRKSDLTPRIPADTDYWPYKSATDVVVQGVAFASGEGGRRDVQVSVADRRKVIAVFGQRRLRIFSGGRRRIDGPEPFEQIPLSYENAYGGCDWKVQPDTPDDPFLPFIMESDHPGLYPRNPFGKGYLVQPEEGLEIEMPNLEDPGDLLHERNIVTGDPLRWFRQPLPWCLDWVHPASFPRNTLMLPEVDAWYPGPEDRQMPEVERGFLPGGYRTLMGQRGMDQGPHPLFFQGGSHGMVFDKLTPGTPFEISGMHPERETISFALPAPPVIKMAVDGDWQPVRARLHHVVCRPGELKVNLVYGARRELPRPFIPGIHKHIPVAAMIDGQGPVEYRTPPTVRDQIAAAKEAQGGGG